MPQLLVLTYSAPFVEPTPNSCTTTSRLHCIGLPRSYHTPRPVGRALHPYRSRLLHSVLIRMPTMYYNSFERASLLYALHCRRFWVATHNIHRQWQAFPRNFQGDNGIQTCLCGVWTSVSPIVNRAGRGLRPPIAKGHASNLIDCLSEPMVVARGCVGSRSLYKWTIGPPRWIPPLRINVWLLSTLS